VRSLLLLPKLEDSWNSVAEVCRYCIKKYESELSNLDILYVDREQIFKQSKNLLKYQLIINLDHSVETIKTLSFIKNILKSDCKLKFYALGMASSYYWPIIKWGLAKNMDNRDEFYVSCDRDRTLTSLAFPNSNIVLSPFLLTKDYNTNNSLKSDYLYIGRLCFQKNIHGLLHYIKFLKDQSNFKDCKLYIAGNWDESGLPIVKTNVKTYKVYIESLIKSLKLTDDIIFLGEKTEDEVDEILESQKWTFISLSLQVDENFGLAAYKALKASHGAILSNWGGHSQLAQIFSEKVDLLNVNVFKNGPVCQFDKVHSNILESGALLCEGSDSYSPLIISKKAYDILKQREEFKELKAGDVLFSSNFDPLYLELCKIYSNSDSIIDKDNYLYYDPSQLIDD